MTVDKFEIGDTVIITPQDSPDFPLAYEKYIGLTGIINAIIPGPKPNSPGFRCVIEFPNGKEVIFNSSEISLNGTNPVSPELKCPICSSSDFYVESDLEKHDCDETAGYELLHCQKCCAWIKAYWKLTEMRLLTEVPIEKNIYLSKTKEANHEQ